MKLRAKYGRKHYKNDETYLNAVYRRNKALIDEYMADVGKEGGISTLKQFKANIFETQNALKRKGKTATITHAVGVFTSSSQFIPEDRFYEIHFKENLVKGLKRFGAMKVLYNLTKMKFNIDEVQYIGDNSYLYRGYVIKLTNSPQKISIYKGKTGTIPREEIVNPRLAKVI